MAGRLSKEHVISFLKNEIEESKRQRDKGGIECKYWGGKMIGLEDSLRVVEDIVDNNVRTAEEIDEQIAKYEKIAGSWEYGDRYRDEASAVVLALMWVLGKNKEIGVKC